MRSDAMAENVAGVVLVGAEGCSEVGEVSWLRDATEDEIQQLKDVLAEMSKKAGTTFDFSEYKVDGTGRPYWPKTVLVTPETPAVAIRKARDYSRVVRIHLDY